MPKKLTITPKPHPVDVDWLALPISGQPRRTPDGEAGRLWCLLYLQEHGAGRQLSRHCAKIPDRGSTRILAPQRSRFTHYYFYIRDEVFGPMVMRVASFFPFQTSYYLNGHSFIEQELWRAQIGFPKAENASSPLTTSRRCKPPPTSSVRTSSANGSTTSRKLTPRTGCAAA